MQPTTFDPKLVAGLPEPARRWLEAHAITPGTPLWRSVELAMVGEIRIASWRPFTANQLTAHPQGLHLGSDRPILRVTRERLRQVHLGEPENAAGGCST